MKKPRYRLRLLLTLPLALCFGFASCARIEESARPGPVSPTPAATSAPSNVANNTRVNGAEQQARPDLEQRRRDAEQQVENTFDQEAMAAIDETRNAITAIAANNPAEALAAIERATGKINVLLARNPATALLPVAAEVEVIDAAPEEVQAIQARVTAVDRAWAVRDFPTMRVLLDGLASEIHVRTYNLPLATYPAALTEAARLLDQKDNAGAATVLLTALNTLVIVDRVTPLPLIVAQEAIVRAEGLRETDKNAAQTLLDVARDELERARLLGYAGNDPEYAALNKAIADVESQLKGTGDTASVFSSLKERIAAFFKRLSETDKRG